jgi:quercetin dioxygenase-like cupin family protein
MASEPTGPAHDAGETSGSPQRAPQQLRSPLLAFDLAAEAAQLRYELAYQESDRNANTLLKEPNARVVLTALRQGARLQEHQTAGWVLVQTISGRLQLQALGQDVDLPAGQLVALAPNVAHAVDALEDSVFLRTLAGVGPSGSPGA